MVEYKLVYFNGRGRAEVARFLFTLADQKYEDFRVESEKWPELKANSPFGQLPYLEIKDNGKVTTLAQSAAINRYLARKFQFDGKTDLEKAEIDMYGEQINDLISALTAVFQEKDPERKKALDEKNHAEKIPAALKPINEKLAATGTGFIVGSSVSWIDLHLFNTLDWLGDKKDSYFAQFPHIKALDEKIRAIPKIANWISKRPVTTF